ncbi:MAG: Fe-S cluster assembly protein SufD [Thiomicrospira sp.]
MTTLSKPTKKPSPLAQSAVAFYLQQAQPLIDASRDLPLGAFRQSVAERFAQQGFPTRRDEDWKYTPLNAFLQTHYRLPGVASIDFAQVKRFLPPFAVMHLVFVDGYFSETFSDDLGALPEGLTIESVKDALDFVSGHQALMSHESQVEAEPFGCLNSLLFDDGVLIQLEQNCILDRPVLCTYLQTQSEHANTTRNRIVLAEGAQMTLIEQYVSLSDELNAFNNVVSEVELAQSAQLDQVVLQAIAHSGMHFGLQFVEQATQSRFSSHYIGLGAAISRHQNTLYMRGEHVESAQFSACLAQGNQVMDTRTHTQHQACWGVSRQLHKLVLDDQATGVFNGMIHVARGAQKTDGLMDNKNLLLSKQAQVDSKPQLEIYADDVKCSHGSASGQISDEQIFYLRARGIAEQDARRLVTQAFLLEPLESISSAPVRDWLAGKLVQKLNR